jgi:hypothetical protein
LLPCPASALVFRKPTKSECDIFRDRQVGEECIVLKEEADPALTGRDVDALFGIE